jgi:hypothetical protein
MGKFVFWCTQVDDSTVGTSTYALIKNGVNAYDPCAKWPQSDFISQVKMTGHIKCADGVYRTCYRGEKAARHACSMSALLGYQRNNTRLEEWRRKWISQLLSTYNSDDCKKKFQIFPLDFCFPEKDKQIRVGLLVEGNNKYFVFSYPSNEKKCIVCPFIKL